ncbi:hypothetical protein [Mycobacterium malmoense]|uniref:hypothetical protein n=1 Tax=Mycobacterium malmoense TaxID=1780 RepID=UPI0008F973B8|nr:hypothetical protein [Mycobacterium malmoense]OIN79192.1 hypothetical protein BMG05_19280 [Mycobacterium malmoense]
MKGKIVHIAEDGDVWNDAENETYGSRWPLVIGGEPEHVYLRGGEECICVSGLGRFTPDEAHALGTALIAFAEHVRRLAKAQHNERRSPTDYDDDPFVSDSYLRYNNPA